MASASTSSTHVSLGVLTQRLSFLIYCYAAVGGGFFTGRYNSPDEKVEPGSRFDPEKGQGRVCLSLLCIKCY